MATVRTLMIMISMANAPVMKTWNVWLSAGVNWLREPYYPNGDMTIFSGTGKVPAVKPVVFYAARLLLSPAVLQSRIIFMRLRLHLFSRPS
jgi:hypothetical protein